MNTVVPRRAVSLRHLLLLAVVVFCCGCGKRSREGGFEIHDPAGVLLQPLLGELNEALRMTSDEARITLLLDVFEGGPRESVAFAITDRAKSFFSDRQTGRRAAYITYCPDHHLVAYRWSEDAYPAAAAARLTSADRVTSVQRAGLVDPGKAILALLKSIREEVSQGRRLPAEVYHVPRMLEEHLSISRDAYLVNKAVLGASRVLRMAAISGNPYGNAFLILSFGALISALASAGIKT